MHQNTYLKNNKESIPYNFTGFHIRLNDIMILFKEVKKNVEMPFTAPIKSSKKLYKKKLRKVMLNRIFHFLAGFMFETCHLI